MTDALTFTPAATAFYAALKADNSKAFWDAHKAMFDAQVKLPMTVLADLLGPRWGTFKFYRPHRDIRFSRDKSPYKLMYGGAARRPGGAMLYMHLWASGLMAVAGHYLMEPDQVARLRTAIAGPPGDRLAPLLAALTAQGFTISPGGAEVLKTTPRGFAPDHPRADLLRWKGLMVTTEVNPAGQTVEQMADRLTAFWTAATPLSDWLNTHVGPTQQAPRGRD